MNPIRYFFYMGRVFSYEEITEGNLPTADTFDSAQQVFSELVASGVDKGWLDGAFVYGSVALGLANRRSDFDAFLALTDSTPKAYGAAKELINTVLGNSNRTIPIVPIVQPRQALETGRHEMDRFFGQHLSSEFRLVQGNDPADYISYAPNPASEILASYLFQKRRRITNAYTSSLPLDFRDGNGIQRMLELPSAVGRKVLQAFAEAGYIAEAVDKSADKTAVLAHTYALLINEGAGEGFDELVRLDGVYYDLLAETLSGSVTKETYEDEIKELHAKMPIAISWLDKLEQNLLIKLS